MARLELMWIRCLIFIYVYIYMFVFDFGLFLLIIMLSVVVIAIIEKWLELQQPSWAMKEFQK